MTQTQHTNSSLAIIIPAYKSLHFEEAIESIASQTCKDFTLYIGDDNSPSDLYNIVKKYEDKIHIVYKRFDRNLGGQDLVAQWGRCIDLNQGEEWIWLFSDDDTMQPGCVKDFYTCVNANPNARLLHFNIEIIDQHGRIINRCNPFPRHMEVGEFFSRKIKFKLNSSVVEYIFKRKLYYDEGGFKSYDLGWCADDASWIQFGRQDGITSISPSKVSWRYSGSNISSNIFDKEIVLRKLNSSVSHINWAKNFFKDNALHDQTTQFDKLKWIVSVNVLTPAFSIKEKFTITLRVINTLGYKNIKAVASAYLGYCILKRRLVPLVTIKNFKKLISPAYKSHH